MKTDTGTQEAAALAKRDQLVLENVGLVRAIAATMRATLPAGVELDDLIQTGMLGLFDAASKFKDQMTVPFPSYAKFRIRGAIIDSLRQQDCVSRDVRHRQKQLGNATHALSATLQRTPTEVELAEWVGVSLKHWRSIAVDIHNSTVISSSSRPADQSDLPAPDLRGKPGTRPDVMFSQGQLKGMLGKAMTFLPNRYQTVVKLYYTGDLTMKEIGIVLGINESRVSQIHKAALGKLSIEMERNGILSSSAFYPLPL